MSDAMLTAQVSELYDRWQTREDELRAWLGGTATGGANSNGTYSLTDAHGVSYLVKCPARIVADFESPTTSSAASASAAAASATSAAASRTAAETAQAAAVAAQGVATTRRDEAASSATLAATGASQAQAWAAAAAGSATDVTAAMAASLAQSRAWAEAAMGATLPVTTLSTSRTLTADDCVVLCDTSAGNKTVTLPNAASFPTRRYTLVKTVADNILGIASTSSQTINGEAASAQNLTTQWSRLTVVSDGANWVRID